MRVNNAELTSDICARLPKVDKLSRKDARKLVKRASELTQIELEKTKAIGNIPNAKQIEKAVLAQLQNDTGVGSIIGMLIASVLSQLVAMVVKKLIEKWLAK